MSFGFPAFHTEHFSATAANTNLREAVLLALDGLSWRLREETPDRIIGSTSVNVRSWSEKLIIEFLADNSISVTSKCALRTQCVDWGKNKSNVGKFLAELSKHA